MSSNIDFPQATTERSYQRDHPCASHLRILDAEAGLIERTRDKIALVGYATSSRDLAPFDDPAYDICGLNQIYRFLPRIDVHADLHINWDQENVEGTDHRGWLRDCGIPVLMTERQGDLPTSVRFPIEAVSQIACDYFTSTVALLLGWAIHQGYREIGLYGIDLVVGTEYETQRQCAEFWIGVAHGRGINVRLPAECALLRHSHRYGYELEPEWWPAKLSEFNGREESLVKQREALISKLHALDGALHEVSRHETWTSDPMAREQWLQERKSETMAMLATIDGAAQETMMWRNLLQLRQRGAVVPMRRS